MTNGSIAAQAARKAQAIKILGGTQGEIEINGKKQSCRVAKSGMIVGDGKRNQALKVNPFDLQSVEALVGDEKFRARLEQIARELNGYDESGDLITNRG